MKRVLSVLIAAVMVLSMIPAVYAAEPVVIASGTDVAATVAEPVTYTWTAESNGTLTVTMGAASPGWRFSIFDAEGNTVGLPKSGKTEKSNDFELTGGETYTFSATGFNSSTWDEVAANITYTLTFVAADEGGEIELAEYEISDTALALGDNTLSLLETAYTTIYVYEPTETGIFTFTAPEGAVLGYWGAGSWFLNNPNSTTNTCEWTCTGVGQSAYIGVSGVTGSFNLNVAKTGDYEVVEIPVILYENKATLAPFTLPEGSKLGSYIDVTSEAVYTAVLGDDGYYHLDSADGDIILVDMDYQDIVLSDALLSDRPVMYAYVTDEDGNTVKYDIGEAVKEYETVMDANGYYPLTEDLILFYDVYGNGSAIYSYHVTGSYNEENVWMYCMRTATFPEVTEPEETEPEVTEPEVTEPEVTEPEETEPEVTEPEETEPEVTEPEVTEPEETEPLEPAEPLETLPNTFEAADNVLASVAEPVVYTWTAPANGTLTVQMNATTPGWRYEIRDAANNTVGLAQTGSTYKTATFTLTGNETYTFTATGFEFDTWSETSANISYALSFIADDSEGGEVEKVERVVSTVQLAVGDNTLTLDETAITTIYKFKPSEAATYSFTAPEGAIVGYWGATNNYLVNPNNNSNTCQWTCTGVGQSAFIGVSGVDGEFVLTVAKVEVTEPEETDPTEPEETEPEVTEPEETEPEETEPNTSVPEVPAGTLFAVVVNGEVTTYTYASELNTAVASVESSASVILYEDVSLGAATLTIPAEKNIVLDLNGCTLTANKSNGGTITVNGTLTVQDSSTAGDGMIENTATSSDRGIVVSTATASLTIKGGNIVTKTQAIRVEKGSLIIEAGSLTATNYAVYVSAEASATIKDGVFTSGVGSFYYPLYAGTGATVSVTGGYFKGNIPGGNGINGSLSGGYYIARPKDAFLSEGCSIEEVANSEYLYIIYDPNAVPDEPEEPEKLVDQWNLVLDDDLLVNFYLNLSEDAQVQITVGGKSFTYAASELATTDDGKYIASVRLAAAQMTDAITVQVVGAEADAVSYTVRQYADTVLSDSKLSAYHALVKEMLNYGGAAQNYFTYNTDTLANADITGVAAEEVPESAEDVTVSDRISALNFYGASLVYRDKIAVRFYFTGDVSGCTFADANGNTYTAQENGDMYYVEIADILPQDLDQQIELTVTDANGNEISVAYGPMNYIVRMNAKGSDSLKALLKALYNYHLAAKALRTAA